MTGAPLASLPWGWSAGIAVSAMLCITGFYRGLAGWPAQRLVYVFKPLTTLLTGLMVMWHGGVWDAVGLSAYGVWISVGLLFSLAGDIFLMLPQDRFVPGLASFLVAHLAYLTAFWQGVPADGLMQAWPWLGYVAGGLLTSAVLLPRVPAALRAAVVVYMLALLAMAAVAASRGMALHTGAAWCAAAGAWLFVVSDTLLAFNRFHAPMRSAGLTVHASYFAAQWLMGLSAVGMVSSRG